MSRLLLILVLFASALASAAPVEIIPPELRGALQPQVAVTPAGRIHLVFGKGAAIYHCSSDDGQTFSPPSKVGELKKLALGMRRGPRVVASERLVCVTAISHADGQLHIWTSADGGKTWKEGAPLNTAPNSAREGLHALAGDGRGRVVAVWLDLRNGGTELWSRVSPDGGATWAADTLVYHSPDGHICECCVPNVALSPSGEIAAMWRNWLDGARDLYLATSRDDGRTFRPAQKLGSGTWQLKGCPMDGGGLAAGPNGQWLATWRRESTVFATEDKSAERTLAANSAQPLVGLAGKTPFYLWQSDGALMLQRAGSRPTRFAEDAAFAAVASGPAGAVVAWESGARAAPTILVDMVK